MPRIERLEQNTPKWLRWRLEGIGSSDAPVIMGEGGIQDPTSAVGDQDRTG
jgi:predicted phage-related endonuclease